MTTTCTCDCDGSCADDDAILDDLTTVEVPSPGLIVISMIFGLMIGAIATLILTAIFLDIRYEYFLQAAAT